MNLDPTATQPVANTSFLKIHRKKLTLGFMEPLRKVKRKRKSLSWFESLVKSSENLSSPSSTNHLLLPRVTISDDLKKKYSVMKFWLVAISKFISDDLILVSCVVRKMSQNLPVAKEGFLYSIDSQSPTILGLDKPWIPCLMLIPCLCACNVSC